MKFNKLSKILVSVSVIGWIIIGLMFFNSNNIDAANNDRTNIYKKIQLFSEVLNTIRENYVEDLDISDLIDSAIEGMLDEVDPHTTYFDEFEFDKFTSDTQGEFGGLGISIDKKGDYITVVTPIEGTPAYRMGIMAGDKIIKVDGESVVGVDTSASIKLMRGEPGTKVVITIERPGVDEELDFEIVRDVIKIKSIPYAFKMDNGIGYIRIRQFNANTTSELRDVLDDLENQGIRGLLIDLRFNPGGLLSEAITTVNEFIGKDKRVVFTKGRIPQANQEYFTRYNRMRSGYPVVALINSGSASAAEIFAGSLQDWDKGLIVGQTSFGKGSVQRLFPLSDGKGLKVTTAKYYINSGRCIHKDLNDKLLKDERVLNGEIDREEIEKMEEEADEKNHEIVFYTSKGRKVYGGGGVNPDIEIKQSLLNKFEIELRRKSQFFNYSVDYLLEHEVDVSEDFEVDDEMVSDFLDFAKQNEVEFEQADVDSSYTWIKNELEANIIGRKFGDVAQYKTAIKDDTQLQEALSYFDRFNTLDEMFDYVASLKLEETELSEKE
ncbi:MAG: S41 family peptidase [Candidatus Cloacimonetes bacterium]|nr:S41 family peptidase [Candidatus Cloacimonadota bacterium]MCF7814463.1 S41 family peptidase [Candidatus Cloacimonadota bacterium]MCF7869038.1 S41 family peptidase [Candidatus Cloacimonadota bacterium]MCF7884433.1 S41 family peptidase [Candidatus Cloacimonadota bacterium]